MAVSNTAAPALIRRANLALSTPYRAPENELETLIARLFAEVLTIDYVGVDDDFTELGGDSLLGEALSMHICERTGFDVHLDSFAERCSPGQIAELLRSKGIVAPNSFSLEPGNDFGSRVQIVCLHQGKNGTPLYCMPNIFGSVRPYIELARVLGGNPPVYGIQIADRAQAFASLQEMAALIAAKLLTHCTDGPICLIGYSFGGYLAIEVARQLVEQGKLVPFVGMIDTKPGPVSLPMAHRIRYFARNVGPWARSFLPWALKVTTREIAHARHWINFRNIVLRKMRGQHQWHNHDWYKNLPEGRKTMVDRNFVLTRNYRFEGTHSSTIFLFRTRPSAATFELLFRPDDLDDFGWRRVLGSNVHVVYLPGDHPTCIAPPSVTSLANQLSLALGVAFASSHDTPRGGATPRTGAGATTP